MLVLKGLKNIMESSHITKKYKVHCVKCKNEYTDIEPEDFYCKSCTVEKDAIAKKVDEKMKGRSTFRPTSALEEFDNSPKAHGFVITKL